MYRIPTWISDAFLRKVVVAVLAGGYAIHPLPAFSNSIAPPLASPEAGPKSVQASHDDHHHHDGHAEQSPNKIKNIDQLESQDIDGINTDPSDLKVMVQPGTIVHFWASWCGPCEEEIPDLLRFYRQHILGDLKSEGIRLITISNDMDVKLANRFIKKHEIDFPVYFDPELASNEVLVGRLNLPSTVMVGADGRLHRLSLGKFDWSFPDLSSVLASIAASSANNQSQDNN